MEITREEEAKAAMLKTPSIQPMHEFMYLDGVKWADTHPSQELIDKIIATWEEYKNKPSATTNNWTFRDYLITKLL